MKFLAENNGRKTQLIVIGGGDRGANGNIPAIYRLQDESTSISPAIEVIDPVVGRARILATKAQQRGIPATWHEDRIENIMEQQGWPIGTIICLHIDDPRTIARILRESIGKPYHVIGDMIIRTPQEQLLGVSFANHANDHDGKNNNAFFFAAAADISPRAKSADVLGPQATDEENHRDSFRNHLTEVTHSLAADLIPQRHSLEITTDGKNSMPVFIEDSRMDWKDLFHFSSILSHQPLALIRRGTTYAVAEYGPNGLRLHIARLRKTDGKISAWGAVIQDPATIASMRPEEAAWYQQELNNAAQRAEQSTWTAQQPIFTTD